MKRKTKKRKYSGKLQFKNGISFRSDIAFSLSDPNTGAAYSFIQFIITAAASLSAVFMIESFLNSELTVTGTAPIFFTVIFTAFSVLMLSRKVPFFNVIGAIYLILNTIFIISQLRNAVGGFMYGVYCYAKKAKLSAPFFAGIISDISDSEINMCFMTLAFLFSLIISLACIYRTNFPILFICTFPIFELGAFWGWEPYAWTLCFMIVSWIVTLSMNLINHTTRKRGSQNTFAVYARKKAFYLTSDDVKKRFFSLGSSFALILTAAVFAFSMLVTYLSDNYRPESLSQLRRDISDDFEDMTMKLSQKSIISSQKFPGRGKMIGGINGGRLGLYDKIDFSGATALRFTSSRQFNAPLYLRGYTGVEYSKNCWDPIKVDNDVKKGFDEFGADIMDYGYFRYTDTEDMGRLLKTELSISVINASKDVLYAPYNALYSECSEAGDAKYDGIAVPKKNVNQYDIEYALPNAYSWEEIIDYNEINSYIYEDFGYYDIYAFYNNAVIAQDEYREIPTDLMPLLDTIYSEAGITPEDSIVTVLDKYRRYFEREGFYYTKEPGVTPSGEDFIEYFLTEQKKGYCTYYASAGVMLMRRLGIPARYVEGYVVEPEQFVSEDQQIRVSDRCAHAWCEVFIRGYGWYPLEFTPGYENDNPNLTEKERNIADDSSSSADSGNSKDSKNDTSSSRDSSRSESKPDSSSKAQSSSESGSSASDSSDVSSDSGSSAGGGAGGGKGGADSGSGTGSGSGGGFVITTQMIYMSAVMVFVLIVFAAAAIRRKNSLEKLGAAINSGDFTQAVIACYMSYQKYISLIGINENGNVTDSDMAAAISDKLEKIEHRFSSDFMQLSEMAISAYMGGLEADEDDADYARGALKSLRAAVYGKLGKMQRFSAKWVQNLY